MRIRCVHSCVLALVLGLLIIYSTFLTVPLQLRYVDPAAAGDVNSTVTTSTVAPVPPVSPAATVPVQVLGEITDNNVPSFGPSSANVTIPSLLPSVELNNETPHNSRQPIKRLETKTSPLPSGVHLSAQVAQGKGVITRQLYESGFLLANPQICPAGGEKAKLLILITTAPGHRHARDAIRMTWGHFTARRDIALGFFLGRTLNVSMQRDLEAEQELYSDLIQGNFIDSYDNLTLKTVSMLEWTQEYCPKAKFVLKTDDDMFIHVPNLLDFAQRHWNEKRHIYGRLALKWKPVRNHKSKYYVSTEQYRQPFYPDFTTGPAYLLTSDIIRDLYTLALEKKYLKLEDVYTTGIVAHDLKIKRAHVEAFANKKISLQTCKLQKVISLHMIQFHEQFDIWKKVQDGRIKCK